jgi:hypothetical protein
MIRKPADAEPAAEPAKAPIDPERKSAAPRRDDDAVPDRAPSDDSPPLEND